MANDGDDLSRKQMFHKNKETFQRTPETKAEHRFPARTTGVVQVPLGSRGPRSLYIRKHGDSFGFTLRHFIVYPPESITERDGRHEAVGALLAPMDSIFVRHVLERGAAEQAGLQKGDRILCVNNVTATDKSYAQVVQLIKRSPPYLHLLVLPKEEDVIQKYFPDAAHNPVSNQIQAPPPSREELQRQFLRHRYYNPAEYCAPDYGHLVPRRTSQIQQQRSADNIYSTPREYAPVVVHQPKSVENIYSTPQDNHRSLHIYTEPIINDSTQRPRAQPQVPLYKKMGRRASEGSTISEKDYYPEYESIGTTMNSNKSTYIPETYTSLEMPGLNYPNQVGCRHSLDAGRRESSSSLTSSIADGSKDSLSSYDSSSTLTGQETDDSVVMTRLRKSVQKKEEFLRRPSSENAASVQREFYGRPKKLDKPKWPPAESAPEIASSPTRKNKPTHQSFQRVKNDIDFERDYPHDNKQAGSVNQQKNQKGTKDWQFHSNLGKIHEGSASVPADNFQTNGNSSDAEDRRNYPPNLKMVSKRTKQFETGRMLPDEDVLVKDRTSFHKSELARLSMKKAVPNVAGRTRDFETMSNEPRRDASSSSTSSAAVLRRSYRDSRSLDSSGANVENQSIRMRERSNSADSWAAAMNADHKRNVDSNSTYSSGCTIRTGHEAMDTSCPLANAPDPASPLIPESVERLHTNPLLVLTPAPPISPPFKSSSPVRPTQLDLSAPKRPVRHLRPPQATADTPPPAQSVCTDKPLVVRRTKNTNLTDEDRVMRRESYLKATEGGRMQFENPTEFSDGEISPHALRSAHRRWRPPLFPGDIQQLRKLFEDAATSLGGSVSGSSSSISLEREKITGSPSDNREKEKQHNIVREGPLHCKITDIDGKRSGDRSWKQIWAVLKGPRLFLNKDRHHQSPIGTTEPADQSLASGIDMRGSVVQVADDYTKRKHVLRVSSAVPIRSELLLQADNTVELAEWVKALQDQVASSTDVEATLDQYGNNNKQQAVPQTIPATTSIQVPQQSKAKLSLRNRSPSGQSPVSKTRKPSQSNEPSTSPKSKTWRGRVAKQFRKIQGASSPSSPTAPEGSTFGVPLEHCLPSNYNQYVPRFVEVCTDIVESRGLENIGIYRVPGNNAAVTALTDEVNRYYDEVTQADPRWNDVHVVSSLLKSFFRKMPDSLLTTAAYPYFIAADKIENPNGRMSEIRKFVRGLPPHHYHTLKHLILHLKKVEDHSEINKMEAKNLAIIFGPTIVKASEENMENMVTNMTHQCKIVESLLIYADWFFSEDDVECLNLPAPIAPAEIFQNEAEISTALLRDNISKVENFHHKDQKEKKEFIHQLFNAAHKKCKRKPNTKPGNSSQELLATSPNGPKYFPMENYTNTSDLKESANDTKTNVIPTTVTDMENTSELVAKLPYFNYKTGEEQFRKRIENFIQETEGNLQRQRKHESNSNNSLELRLPPSHQMSSSASNVNQNQRLSLSVNANDQRVITKTHSASNVFNTRTTNTNNNGRNAISSSLQFNKNNFNNKKSAAGNNKTGDQFNNKSDIHTNSGNSYSDYNSSPESRIKPFSFGLRRGSSAENINTSSVDLNNGNMKKVKYESENDSLPKTSGSLDSLTKIQSNLDDGGDLLATMTKIFDEKTKELNPLKLSIENIPYADESPEKHSRQSYLNKENIPSSPKLYRNPSLHKNQFAASKLSAYDIKLKEKQADKEKDEDSSLNTPNNDRHITETITLGTSKKLNILNLGTGGNSKLKRSESLNKPERTVSPLNVKLKRSESLNKASDKLKRSDSLTKTEKTENNISKRRELSSSARRTNKDFAKLKRKNGMPERSIKRRHTVGGTKDPDKITLLDIRCQEELSDVKENHKEKNLRTSSPDLSSTRRDRLFFEVNVIGPADMVVALRQHLMGARPQSFPESSVYKVPLESHV